MPIIDFPKGPMATPEAYPIDEPEAPDIGIIDIVKPINFFECSDCGSGVFHLYDDGEIECANPRCGGVMSGIIVVEIGNDNA